MDKRRISRVIVFTIITVTLLIGISFGVKDSVKFNDGEAISLKDYLGTEYDNLEENEKDILNDIYDEILEIECEEILGEETSKKYDELWKEFDNKSAEYGIEIEIYYEDVRDSFNESIKVINKHIDELISNSNNNNNKKQLLVLKEEISNLEELNNMILEQNNTLEGDLGWTNETDIIEEYKVRGGNIDKKDFKIIKEHILIWENIRNIIPKTYLNMIKVFEINTDGIDGNMAFVSQENESATDWRIGVDIKDLINSKGELSDEFDNTILHEFAHILTLNPSQMQKNIKNTNTYTLEEGCLKEDSYLNLFYQKFWKKIISDHGNEDFFYEQYSNQFLTDYAMTNPAEDIAESYYHFILEDKPLGNSVKENKIKFFYSFKELVKQRKEIRKNINLN